MSAGQIALSYTTALTERTLVLKFPAKFEVCGTCHGAGKRVDPRIDGNGLSTEDFDEDPDFRESYFAGHYDVTCDECQGQRVVPTIDEDRLTPRMRTRLALVEKQQEQEARFEREWAAEARMERSMGA